MIASFYQKLHKLFFFLVKNVHQWAINVHKLFLVGALRDWENFHK